MSNTTFEMSGNSSPASKEDEVWSTECQVDELSLNLAAIEEITTNDKGRDIPIRKYYRQALELMKWIPVAKTSSNEFVINISDLTPEVKEGIESIIDTPETLQYDLREQKSR